MLGDLISAGVNLFQGTSNREAQERMNAQNIASQERMAAQNIALQREFAQSGIRWKVEDAVAAGLHPLIGAGAQAQSFSPVSIGGGGTAPQLDLGTAGQDIGRAVKAMITKEEKEDAQTAELNRLSLERGRLENDVLRQKLRRESAPGTPPGLPSGRRGSGGSNDPGDLVSIAGRSSGSVVQRKTEREHTAPGDASQSRGAVPDTGFAFTGSGWAPIPSKDVKEQIEDVMPAEWSWGIRNYGLPTFGLGYRPPAQVPLKEGYRWGYDPFRQEYIQVPKSRFGGRSWWAPWRD